MKRLDALIPTLVLSLCMLAYMALISSAPPATAQLSCDDLSNCCTKASCNSSGTVNVCTLSCSTGAQVICGAKNQNGLCPDGGGGT